MERMMRMQQENYDQMERQNKCMEDMMKMMLQVMEKQADGHESQRSKREATEPPLNNESWMDESDSESFCDAKQSPNKHMRQKSPQRMNSSLQAIAAAGESPMGNRAGRGRAGRSTGSGRGNGDIDHPTNASQHQVNGTKKH